MGKDWEEVMDSIKKIVSFPVMNFGRTLVVLFQLLNLVLWNQGCVRRNRI